MINASHMMLPKNITHSRYGCSIDNRTDNPTIGRNRNTKPCLSIALMVRTIKWTLVIPITALGLRLNAVMKCRLNDFGIAAYRVSPALPVLLIYTLPVCL